MKKHAVLLLKTACIQKCVVLKCVNELDLKQWINVAHPDVRNNSKEIREFFVLKQSAAICSLVLKKV